MNNKRQATTTAKQDKGPLSSRRKREAALRLLRGEDLHTLSREYGVRAAR